MFCTEDDFINDDLEVLEFIEKGGLPRKRYTRKNYYEEMDNYSFFKTFRVYKETVVLVLEKIQHALEYDVPNLNESLSPMQQLLIGLKMFSTGEHLQSVAHFAGVDTATVSRTIVRVSEAIASLYPQYCVMPENLQAEQVKFFDIAKFPRVIGVIDGTHIKIQNPGGEEGEIFRNRKGYHSINTQIVCDSDMKIMDIVARWPGSTHDSTIFNNSRICARFEQQEFGNGILLGDGGYPLQDYLLTPLRQPQNESERLYNESFNLTRNIVERTIGVLKSRFRCLAYGLRLKLETSMAVVIACAVLHNICREQNEPEPQVEDHELLNYYIELGQVDNQIDQANNDRRVLGGRGLQNDIINNYFGNAN